MDYIDCRGMLEKLLRHDIPDQFNEMAFIRKHHERITLLLQGEIIPPYEIIIQPSSVCNLRCIWCVGNNIDNYNNTNMPQRLRDPDAMLKMLKGILSYKKVVKVANEEKEYRVERIQFSGLTGEPLCHKESVLTGMQYLIDNDVFTGLFTNGVFMDNQTWDTLSKINYVLVSLDAGTSDSYNFMKCSGNGKSIFDEVCKNIMGLVQAREKTKRKVDVNTGFVLNPYNYNEIYLAAKRMKELGVHYFRIKTDIAGKLNLTEKEIKYAEESLNKAKELQDDFFKIVEIHKIYDNESKKRHFCTCYMNTIMSAVAADGNVYPCNYFTKHGRMSYGNCIDSDFGDIFEQKRSRDVCIPQSCPAACDPYKNRANTLIQELEHLAKDIGIAQISDLVHTI